MSKHSLLLRICLPVLLVVVLLASFITVLPVDVQAADSDPYYWVGGTGNWSDVNHWSSTDDGTGGDYATVPNSTNPVYFATTAFTGAGQVVTVDANTYAKSIDASAATNSPLIKVTQILWVYGDITIPATVNVDIWPSQAVSIRANSTLDIACTIANGGTFRIGETGYSPAVTLARNLATGSNITLNFGSGSLDTAGYSITAGGAISKTSSAAFTLTPSSSAISCADWNYSGSNLTVTANTATINISGTGALAGGSADYNGADFNLNGTAHTVSGSFTCANLTRTGTATKTDSVTFTSGTTVTVTDTLTLSGNSATNRLLVQSSTLGSPATLNAATVSVSNADFMDITGAGAGSWDLSGATGGSGDCGGNTGITFTEAAAQTSSKASTWSDATMWTSRVPLPQDDVNCSHNVTVDMPRIGKSVTFSGVITINQSTLDSNINYGSIDIGGDVVAFNNNSKAWHFGGRGSYTVTSNGKSFCLVRLLTPGGIYTLQDAFITDRNNISLVIYNGTLVQNGQNITAGGISFSGSATKGLTIDGTVTLNSTAAINKFDMVTSGTTLTAPGSTIVLTNSGTNAQTFSGGGLTYNNVIVQGAGNYNLNITGNNTFNTFKVDASQAAKTITATGTTQTVNDFTRDAGGTNVISLTGGTWTKHGRLVDGTGTFTSSPVYFDNLVETIECTATGTATVTLPHGVTGFAISGAGGATVTDSPKALISGANTITVTAGGDNTFTVETNSIDSVPIALDYITTDSTAIPANVWYAGSNGTDTGATNWIFDDPELSVTTQATTGVTMDKDGVTGGTFNGTINTLLDGTPTIVTYIEYGLTNAYGSQTADVTVYDDGAFTGTIPNNLTPGQTYHYRAVVENGNAGSPFYGDDATFTFTMPTVTTVAVAAASGTTFILTGNVIDMGVASSMYVNGAYGATTAYGGTTVEAVKSGTGAFTTTFTASLDTAHARAVARVGDVYAYGVDIEFSPLAAAASYYDSVVPGVYGLAVVATIVWVAVCIGMILLLTSTGIPLLLVILLGAIIAMISPVGLTAIYSAIASW